MHVERGRLRQIDADADADRTTASLAGLAVALLLVVIGLFLVQALHGKAQLEDCLLSGRNDCVRIVAAR